jgi:simple sugar transport system ATP-binding protein
MDGDQVTLQSPRDALNRGIATVYQDLAVLPLMSISRNFFVGSEPTRGWGPFARFDVTEAGRIATEQMLEIGIQGGTPRSSSGRCRAASARRWRSPGRSTSGRGC